MCSGDSGELDCQAVDWRLEEDRGAGNAGLFPRKCPAPQAASYSTDSTWTPPGLG